MEELGLAPPEEFTVVVTQAFLEGLITELDELDAVVADAARRSGAVPVSPWTRERVDRDDGKPAWKFTCQATREVPTMEGGK